MMGFFVPTLGYRVLSSLLLVVQIRLYVPESRKPEQLRKDYLHTVLRTSNVITLSQESYTRELKLQGIDILVLVFWNLSLIDEEFFDTHLKRMGIIF